MEEIDSAAVEQGQGLPGRYCGLPDALADLSTAAVAILPVLFDGTSTYRDGQGQGPLRLIEASRNMEFYDIETDSCVYRRGIATAPALRPSTSRQMLDEVYRAVCGLLDAGKFVVTLGGEHTIAYPCVKAHLEREPTLTLLQLDAHADLQHSYLGDPWSHACVMRRLLELPLTRPPVAVGIRSMSSMEKEPQRAVRTFFAHDLMDDERWIDAVLQQLGPTVYLTLDLDVFDSGIMPSTGTPEPGGLSWQQVTRLLKRVAGERRLVGCDLVELCPTPLAAPDFLAAKLVYKLLSYHFAAHGAAAG